MIFANEGKVMGMGTAPELAIDVLGVIVSIVEHEDAEDIINCMVECEMECNRDTLKNFAQILIDTLNGISA